MGKGEIARNEQFLLFPQCFQLNQIIVSLFVQIFDIISLFAAEVEEPKIGLSGKGLNYRLEGFVPVTGIYQKKSLTSICVKCHLMSISTVTP